METFIYNGDEIAVFKIKGAKNYDGFDLFQVTINGEDFVRFFDYSLKSAISKAKDELEKENF